MTNQVMENQVNLYDYINTTKYADIVRIKLICEKRTRYETQINSPNVAVKVIHDYIGDSDREEFIILLLDTKHNIQAIHTVSTGTLNSSIVHPREVFKAAILSNSFSIILAHNHPSGDPSPSKEDRAVTEKIIKAGEILGINILDHIIVGSMSDRHYSFKENGLI